jgi:phosphoenolpyruvate phosphomutase
MTPARKLRDLLESRRCEQILEAHNALSAAVVEEAGLPGIWASSLTLSCSLGLRDNGELTMTQALEILESMTARVDIPVLFDGDTGYGHLGHFQQLVRKLEGRRVAGVCIEDKVFPKMNSFVRSEQQALAPVAEFCAKVRAGLDVRRDPDFVVMARTEALIAGLGMDEALSRAERYVEAGADAILVHSKAATAAPVFEFMRRWKGRAPVVCVPTTYYGTPPAAFEEAGISLVIWANHMLRAALEAMRRVAVRIHDLGSARGVEDMIAPMQDLLRLQDADGAQRLERAYRGPGPRAVILAASRGSGLGPLTRDRPKCMIPIGGVPVIEKLIQHLRAEGVRDIAVVRGYGREALQPDGVTLFDNERWADTGEVASLAAARAALTGEVVIAYGDLLCKRYILHELLASPAPITIVVDGSRSFLQTGKPADRVRVSGPPPPGYDEREYTLVEMGPGLADERTHGEWIGLVRCQEAGTEALAAALDAVARRPDGDMLALDAVLDAVARKGSVPVRVLYIQRDWTDIDALPDVAQGDLA